MTPSAPPEDQPIAKQERGLYRRLVAAGVPHGRAIVQCWDAERARWLRPAVPALPPSRGVPAYQMRGASRPHQGLRLDSADNPVCPGVSSQEETTRPSAMAAGAFSGGA